MLYLLFDCGEHRMNDELNVNNILLATEDVCLLDDFIEKYYADEPDNLSIVEEYGGYEAVSNQMTDSLYIEELELNEPLIEL